MTGSADEGAFVGRADEWRVLQRAVDRGLDGNPSTVLVTGPAGIGKSRLVAEFGRTVRERAVTVVDGACLALGGSALPYAPYVSIVEQLVRARGVGTVLELAAPNGTALGRLVPALHVDAPSGGDGGTGLAVLASALSRLLAGIARRTPLVLVIDDVHWADESTRELLPVLVQSLATEPAAVVLTCRDDELPDGDPLLRLLAELVRGPRGTWLAVLPLTRDEQARQLAGLLGEAAAPGVVDRVYARAEGNPFFAEELLAAGSARAPSQLVTGADVPAAIRALLLDRVLALPDATRAVLTAVAVAGRPVDTDLLAAVTELDVPELETTLRPAIVEHVCVQEAGRGAVAFRHALLAEVTAEIVLAGDRVRLHRLLADALADGRGQLVAVERVVGIAYHRHAASDPEAPIAALEAARQLRRVYAFPEALTHYERVLGTSEIDGDEVPAGLPPRQELLTEAAEVAALAGAPDRSVELAERALALVNAQADPTAAGLLHAQLGTYRWFVGDTGVVHAKREGVRLVPVSPPSGARAWVLADLALALMVHGQHRESLDVATEAVQLAREVGAGAAEGVALNALGVDLAELGSPDEGLELLHQARRLSASGVGEVDDAVRPYVNLTSQLIRLGRPADAVELALEGGELADRLGVHRAQGIVLRGNGADAMLRLGRFDDAEALLMDALALDPVGFLRWLVLQTLAEVALSRGQFDEAASWLAEAGPAGVRDADDSVEHALLEVDLATWQGRPDRALEIARDTWARPDIGDAAAVRLTAMAVRASADLQDDARAADAAAIWLDRCRESVGAATNPEPLAWQALATAECSRAVRDPDPAAWEEAGHRWDTVAWTFWAAYCRWRRGEAQLGAGRDREQATATLADALRAATEIGAVALADEIAGLARRARLSLAGTDTGAVGGPGGTFGLTPRELEVLGAVADGLTNRGVGERLYISHRTVSTHVSNLLDKLGAATRAEAVAIARREGLLAD